MPSWNIHTAHVESLLASHDAADLGIRDVNAFLFGNYVPDIYLGYMVADTTYRIDYCLTHMARPHVIPLPDADQFWDQYFARRKLEDASAESLALGVWAHLAADRMYNALFRRFCGTHEVPKGDELRRRKQADFAIFGKSLHAAMSVEVTPALLQAAEEFRPYGVLEKDVRASVVVADDINAHGGRGHGVKVIDPPYEGTDYQLLSAEWMHETFDACDDLVARWLLAWCELRASGVAYKSADVRAKAGLGPQAYYDL